MTATFETFVNRLLNLEKHYGSDSPKLAELMQKFTPIMPDLISLEKQALLEIAETYNITEEEKNLSCKVFDIVSEYGPNNPKLAELKELLTTTEEHLSDEQIRNAWELINKLEKEEEEKKLDRIRECV